MEVKFKIFRFDPETDKKPRYDFFAVETDLNERILDCLNKIRWEQDSSLAYRMSCAHGICGSDGLTINGSPALACQKLGKDFDARQTNRKNSVYSENIFDNKANNENKKSAKSKFLLSPRQLTSNRKEKVTNKGVLINLNGNGENIDDEFEKI